MSDQLTLYLFAGLFLFFAIMAVVDSAKCGTSKFPALLFGFGLIVFTAVILLTEKATKP